MRLIGVIDVRGGYAVHAVAGPRARYTPVQRVDGVSIPNGDPVALAGAYIDRLDVAELYVADLDAIAGGETQMTVVTTIATLGAPLWVDAGVASADRARALIDAGVSQVIVGLETLPSFDALRAICGAHGGDRVAFSLDLRNGVPLVADGASHDGTPEGVAASAAGAGAGSIIVLDLERVGLGRGLDLDLIGRVRRAVPDVTLLAGGGVRDEADLTRLADAGCDGALVATALHEGRVRGHRSATR